ncbi:hypothetical protein FGG08_006306 [Glutinoglossum americanum]|uniref:UBC core domain-containing protein n=1 Tax=Glutinoglossum americanum TaxID=1670608 RepID=A0A9P8I1S6_9PEZI|nr:hypothetical protein FGG08_006306 [Glutinoglossum americanum]
MSTRGQFNTKSPTIRRILREASELASSPSPDFHAAPLDIDLFEWHFTLRGPPSTPYSTGLYHGRILLPPTYPLRPPSFRFLTPSGRFEANREICLSISGHHEETWQPAWGLRTALVALRAFMGGEARGQVGGMEAAEEVRRRLAAESRGWACAGCGGRRNEEILSGEEGEGKSGSGEVPKELRLGYRDELTGGSDGSDKATTSSSSSQPETPTTPTTPTTATTAAFSPALPPQPASPPTPPENQGRPTPPPPTTASTSTAAPSIPAPPPPWLDSLIYLLALLLAIMIARKVWSLKTPDDY